MRPEDGALILTYHAVEAGPAPLCIDPQRFAAHLDCLQALGASTLTVSELAAALPVGELPERAVAITFDDGFASVIDHAVPELLERDMRATIFCVAGHLGGMSDWGTQGAGAVRRALAGRGVLAELARAGFEIGSHGMQHLPLNRASGRELEREIFESKLHLQDALGASVGTFAYPYGALPPMSAKGLVERTYTAACTTAVAFAQPVSDPLALPRVDAHYLRRAVLLRRAATGSLRQYIRCRSVAARARRTLVRDYAAPARG